MANTRPLRPLALLMTVVLVSGCGTRAVDIPSSGSIIPQGSIHLTPGISYSLEQLAVGAAGAALIYLIYDPLAPNWSINETVVNDQTYYLSLRAKSFRTGGDGEAMLILKRRALQLQREKGFASYRILDYSEGIESSTPLTHRYSEGTIQLVRADAGAKP